MGLGLSRLARDCWVDLESCSVFLAQYARAMCPCACTCVPCSRFSPSHPFPLLCWINVSTHLHSLGQRRGKISSLISSGAEFMHGTTHALYYSTKAAGNNSSVLRNRATSCSKNTYIYKMSPPTCVSWGWMGAGAGEGCMGMTQELWPCWLPGTLGSTGKDSLVAKGPAESQGPFQAWLQPGAAPQLPLLPLWGGFRS